MSTALSFKATSSSGNFSNSGQNQYRPVRRRRETEESNILEFANFAKSDRRMVFEKSKDPTYIAFEHIDSLPLHKVITEMTKETIKDIQKLDLGSTLRTSLSTLMQRR
ncbi:MAG: hypothetical protein WCF95_00705 [bacterium]